MKKDNKRYGYNSPENSKDSELETAEVLQESEENKNAEESSAEVETNGPETKNGIIVNASLVNVRKEPSFESEKLEVLKKGDIVTIIGREDSFYKVSTKRNSVAYISSDFIKEE